MVYSQIQFIPRIEKTENENILVCAVGGQKGRQRVRSQN